MSVFDMVLFTMLTGFSLYYIYKIGKWGGYNNRKFLYLIFVPFFGFMVYTLLLLFFNIFYEALFPIVEMMDKHIVFGSSISFHLLVREKAKLWIEFN